MSDYENTALELIDQLKEKQSKEMTDLLESLPQKFYKEYRWPKKVIEQQKLIQIYASVKDYKKVQETQIQVE